MPRGKKRKVVVIRSKDGNNIIGQMYVNNHRQNMDGMKTRRKYDPKTRQHVEIKLKEEKHSS